jgi:hypothetical protein
MLWGCGNIRKLKERAFELKKAMNSKWFFKRLSIRKQLREVLEEIEYQEGRKQYANRPYSFPTISMVGCRNDLSCSCGCWLITRRESIGV